MKLAAFGDSITAGQYLAEDETYVSKLASRFGLETVNAGVPGNTTGQGLARFESDVLERRPNLCIVAFGMNDHVNTAPETAKTPLPQFRANLTLIVERLHAEGIAPLFCTVNPIIEGDAELYYYSRHPREWYRNPDGAQAWIDVYNETIREVAEETDTPLADIALEWRRYLSAGGSLNDLLRTVENSGAADGVHPTAAGQELFASCIGEVLAARFPVREVR
ncbi:SGNH/GDSL hydrolase family protein [Paenibacillus hodogayensis]|uniref:SGNH/GDSL hydrolase family protein n=1 Tax=Paenibacillus hodogayensis TaxID=279208 RepID=A0ABV5VVL3_9BACL